MEGLESRPNEIHHTRKGRGRGKQEGARGQAAEISRGLKNLRGGRREALQDQLHPTKIKITKEELQQKKTELHGKQRKRKEGRAGDVFQAIKSSPGEAYQNTKQADVP